MLSGCALRLSGQRSYRCIDQYGPGANYWKWGVQTECVRNSGSKFGGPARPPELAGVPGRVLVAQKNNTDLGDCAKV